MINIYNKIFNTTDIFAHTNESLLVHSNKTLEKFKSLRGNMIEKLSYELCLDIDIVNELTEISVFVHDFGKGTPYFQSNKLNIQKNNTTISVNEFLSRHSMLSASIFISISLEKLKEYVKSNKIHSKELNKYFQICLVLSYIISKHHSKLGDFKEFNKSYKEFLNIILELDSEEFNLYCMYLNYSEMNFDFSISYLNKNNKNFTIDNVNTLNKKLYIIEESLSRNIEFLYLFINTMFSLLTLSDIISTKEHYNREVIEIDKYSKKDRWKFISNYLSSDIYSFYEEFEKNKKETNNILSLDNINDLRNNIVSDVDKVVSSLDGSDNIYYLESSVGSGKTHVSNRIALDMLDKEKFNVNKIIYALPYTSISDQVFSYASTLDTSAVKYDSKTKLYLKDNLSPSLNVFNHQTLNYKYSIITFVQLFDILFSTSKSSALKRLSLRNSLIVLDEIQSLDVKVLSNFMSLIEKYSKIYEFKILFMSATLPRISNLINVKGIELNPKANEYRCHPSLGKRNLLDTSFFEDKISHSDVLKSIDTKNKRTLLYCITIKQAQTLYNEIKSSYPNVKLLTSMTKKSEKDSIINSLKEKDDSNNYLLKEIILISTSVIEAGVDIDMNQAVVDYSLKESLEQISGRVNRNNYFDYKNSIIYLIDVQNPFFISPLKASLSKRDNNHKNNSIKISEVIKKDFTDKNYEPYYNNILNIINFEQNKGKEYLNNLDLKNFYSEMKLINEESIHYYYIPSDDLKGIKLKDEFLSTFTKYGGWSNYDKNYIKRNHLLVDLEEYKIIIKGKEDKKKYMDYCVENFLDIEHAFNFLPQLIQ